MTSSSVNGASYVAGVRATDDEDLGALATLVRT